jgi:ABC-type multidrug transport system fused ATPase/permease subunit
MRRRLPLLRPLSTLLALFVVSCTAVMGFWRIDRVVIASGRLAGGSLQVCSPRDGIVAEVLTRGGREVRPDDVLVRLDSRDLESDAATRLEGLKGEREARLAELARYEKSVRPGEQEEAKAALDQAGVEQRRTDLEAEATERLGEQGIVGRIQVEKAALKGVDLAIPAGSVVALVGPSGGGKSTFAALLPRYLDAHSGEVTVDGRDVRSWPLKELRRNIGLVPQETQLFHDALEANLRRASRRATGAQMMEALEIAELGEFVRSIPEGLGTVVGEQGLRLSGGERQRLAIARVLLKAPMVYVLDEATSALDPRTERQVLARFLDRVRGRTVVLIAHRLTSLVGVDRIFVLSEGAIVASGTHEDLYRAGGLYRRLYDDQMRAGDGQAAS